MTNTPEQATLSPVLSPEMQAQFDDLNKHYPGFTVEVASDGEIGFRRKQIRVTDGGSISWIARSRHEYVTGTNAAAAVRRLQQNRAERCTEGLHDLYTDFPEGYDRLDMYCTSYPVPCIVEVPFPDTDERRAYMKEAIAWCEAHGYAPYCAFNGLSEGVTKEQAIHAGRSISNALAQAAAPSFFFIDLPSDNMIGGMDNDMGTAWFLSAITTNLLGDRRCVRLREERHGYSYSNVSGQYSDGKWHKGETLPRGWKG